MNPVEEFKKEVVDIIDAQGKNQALIKAKDEFMTQSIKSKYSYSFRWMGRPIIQYPQDMVAMQELIWDLKPDLIIEVGIAHGGSLILYASILELIGKGEVLGVDIDIREHNKKEIESHPMFKRIKMIEGSSLDKKIVDQVKKHTEGKKTVLVSLDSNHTHEHVLEELKLFAPFATKDSYCVVFDTIIDEIEGAFEDRPWGIGDSPKTAVHEFLKTNSDFVIDKKMDNKILISACPDGFLKRVK